MIEPITEKIENNGFEKQEQGWEQGCNQIACGGDLFAFEWEIRSSEKGEI